MAKFILIQRSTPQLPHHSTHFGGNVVSNTQAYLDRIGVSEYSARLRDAGGVMFGDTMVSAFNYLQTIGAGGGEGDHYVYSATNVRLQELSLEYTLNRKYLKNVCDLTFGFPLQTTSG